jgi:hypothetical protein
MPKGKNFDVENPNIKTTFNNAHQFYLQSNVTMPNGGSLINQIADNPHNHADLSILASVGMIILAVNTAMFI